MHWAILILEERFNNLKTTIMELIMMENRIKEYLDGRAKQDPQFATKYANEEKSVKECCEFIVGEVYHSRRGQNVVAVDDASVYGLAVHYYDEEDVEVRKIGGYQARVKTGKPATEEEKVKHEAKVRLEMEEIRKKEERERKKKKAAEADERQLSLF